jgi:hypothetical protein
MFPGVRRPEQSAVCSCKKVGAMDSQTPGGAAVGAVDFCPLSTQRLRQRNEDKK